MDEQAIVAAFKRGNYDDALKLLPPDQLQNRQAALTLTTAEFKATTNHNVTLLHVAAYHGWLDFIENLKDNSAFNCRDSNGCVPLHYAAAGNSLSVIEYLINEQGCDPVTANNDSSSSLHIASSKGLLDVVKYFIAVQKCDPTIQDQYRHTPLHYASESGHMNIIRYLITELGCDPTIPDNDGRLPLHIACHSGHLNIVQCLINEFGCDPTTPSSRPVQSVYRCNGGHLDDTKCSGCNHGFTPLHYASQGGHVNIIRYLVDELGCNPYTKSCNVGSLPFHRACFCGQINAIKYFIEEHKFNPNIQDHHGSTPLHYASQDGHMDVILYLTTELGCNPNTRNINGSLPLHYACLGGHLNVLKYFMTHYSIYQGQNQFIQCLLSTSSNIDSLPLHVANVNYVTKYFNFNSVNYCQDEDGLTPLHYASRGGHMNVI